jgi:hypothetical protein
MPDIERLHAEAEEATIRSEMARSRLQAARSNLRDLGIRWSEAKDRPSIRQSVGPPDPSRHRPTDT